MQKGENLFYRWEVLENISQHLSLKDLLNTATLSKQYNLMLKKYLKEHYELANNPNQSEFQQLKDLLNRKLAIYSKNSKYSKLHASKLVLRDIQPQSQYSVIQTLDSILKVVKTKEILEGKELQTVQLPQRYQIIKITENNTVYCYENRRLYRFKNSAAGIMTQNPEFLQIKGDIEDIVLGFKNLIAIVRQKQDKISLKIFDYNDPLQKYKDAQVPFQLMSLKIQDNFVLGKVYGYFIYNETLYEINLKNGSVSLFQEFKGKKIMKIQGGKMHFMAYQRVRELSSQWTTQDVVKFAQNQGFEDFIKIFKAQKVTGKILLEMDKKYRQQVLGLVNVKTTQKLQLRIAQLNKEDPDSYVIYGWGRASQGALGTNPSKQIAKPIKIKLPNDCQILGLTGFYTVIVNKKLGLTYVNNIDQKTNKQQWKQICNKKVWAVSSVEDNLILIVSATKQKIHQSESETVVDSKKQKLRTAKNIIDKITWDPNLKPQEFRIGFLDKFQGLLQMPFKELQQSQTKQYRIEYFKRGSEVVWDKKKRIDIL